MTADETNETPPDQQGLPLGGVTAPKGFRAAGVAAGIKPSGERDLALVVNDGPAQSAAGVFTTNRVKAAPVLWSSQVVAPGSLAAVVLNSGGANACTGPAGFQDTHATAEKVALALGIGAIDVAVCSTGIIGERLPMAMVLAGVDAAVHELSEHGGNAAADAIRTTDKVSKEAVYRGSSGDGWLVGGMAKGSGMLAPELATLLAVVTTDAVLDPPFANEILHSAMAETFNRIDSDGCMSTNDTVLLLASGASGIAPSHEDMQTAVTAVCRDLTSQILHDAEGSTKDIEVKVAHAATDHDAVEVAKAIARNNLVKCALFGGDPNWGRIVAAVGTTSAIFEPDQLDVMINGVLLCHNGFGVTSKDKVSLSERSIHIFIDLHCGPATATVWTNDLSLAYVHENSAYSS